MRRIVPWLMVTWTIVLSVGWVLAWINYPDQVLLVGPAASLTLVAGGFLWLRVRGNLIGPLLVVGASAGLIYDSGRAYALYSLGRDMPLPGEHMAAWLGTWTMPLFFLCLPLLLVVFPDGRAGGHRKLFVPLFGLVVALVGVGAVGLWGSPATLLTDIDALNAVPAYGILNPAFVLSWTLTFPATVSLVYRYMRGSLVVRQQVKLVLAAAVLVPLLAWVASRFVDDAADSWIMAAAACTAPIAIGAAVVRYRIYDIDRIISRAVAYLLVVGLLGAAFVIGVVWIPNLIPGPDDSPLFVAAATLTVTALFNPVRKRVQAAVDRRFNRSRYDAERVMDQFAGSLRDRVDPEGVIDGWLGVVSETMQPASVSVWVKP